MLTEALHKCLVPDSTVLNYETPESRYGLELMSTVPPASLSA